MRIALLVVVLLTASAASAQGTGTLAGQILEADSVTAVIGANIRIDGTTLGTVTDIDGNYRILEVPAGTHTVTASYTGYSAKSAAVVVEPGRTTLARFVIEPGGNLDCVVGIYQEGPAILVAGPFAARVIRGDGIQMAECDGCGCESGPAPMTGWSEQ